MRVKDIKLLWGRSGNRCAICKIELTPDGETDTIGEIAHIVGRSPDGPRGDGSLPLSERDDFSNLILLCPNHHSEIDKFSEKWSIPKLLQIKSDHEKWVSDQLEHGLISIKPIDNSRFLEITKTDWKRFSQSQIWVATCLTPLLVEDDSIDPLKEKVIHTLKSIKLPDDGLWDPHLNHYNTRPNENGIINSKLDEINQGIGYKIQIFRNGHCELLFCLEASVNRITEYAKDSDPEITKSCRVIRYTHLAEVTKKQIHALKHIWTICLPFKDMTLTTAILNTRNTILYSMEKEWGGAIYGFPVESNELTLTSVINRSIDTDEINESVLKRLVNSFGLILNEIYDAKGEFMRPQKL